MTACRLGEYVFDDELTVVRDEDPKFVVTGWIVGKRTEEEIGAEFDAILAQLAGHNNPGLSFGDTFVIVDRADYEFERRVDPAILLGVFRLVLTLAAAGRRER